MLEGNRWEAFSADCRPPGDAGAPQSSGEDLDLRLDSRECLAEAGSLEASCSFLMELAFGCWEPGGRCPFSALSSPAFLPADLTELPPAFLESRGVLPRSVDRRVSFCLKADLKKDSPFSSDLLSRFRPAFTLALGERRLAMEELLTCFPSPRPSPALAWLPRGELGLELEGAPARSEARLCLEPSPLRLRSAVLPFPGGQGPLAAGPEAFLAGVEEAVHVREEAAFGFWGEGEATESWALGEGSFLGGVGALEDSALLREREGFTETLAGTGEEGEVLD